MTSSPGFSNFNTQSIAASPEPKASPRAPFSMLARLSSNACRVGLAALEYSYPE